MGDGDLIQLDNIQSKEEKAYRAYQLRLAGTSWSEIAARLHYQNGSKARYSVELLIKKASDAADEDRKQEILELELDRLDALQNAVWGMALSGDIKAVEAVLKVMSHRARILSLGEETRGNQISTVIVSDSNYVEALKELS